MTRMEDLVEGGWATEARRLGSEMRRSMTRYIAEKGFVERDDLYERRDPDTDNEIVVRVFERGDLQIILGQRATGELPVKIAESGSSKGISTDGSLAWLLGKVERL